MSSELERGRHAPDERDEERRGHTAPGREHGLSSPQPAGRHDRDYRERDELDRDAHDRDHRRGREREREDEYSDHPLHKVYRKRIRGIRMRWLGSGVVLGVLVGILLTLFASALVVTQFPEVVTGITGQSDVALVIGEGYLNRAVADRLKTYPQEGQTLKVTSLNLDLQPGGRMDLSPAFTADLALFTLDVNATVKNVLTVQDGKLVLNMVGDPQLGNLNVPIDLLPFNLSDQVRKSVDKLNNDLLISELNATIGQNVGGAGFSVQGVSTADNSLTVNLQERP